VDERIGFKTWLSGLENDIVYIFEMREVEWDPYLYRYHELEDRIVQEWDELLYFRIEGITIEVDVWDEALGDSIHGLSVAIYHDDFSLGGEHESRKSICDQERISSHQVSVEELQASGVWWKMTRLELVRYFESLATNRALLDSGYISKERLDRVRYRTGRIEGLLMTELNEINGRNQASVAKEKSDAGWQWSVKFFLGVLGFVSFFILLQAIVI